MVKALLQHGADPNAKTASGASMLHEACGHCVHELIPVLINAGADINTKDGDGWTPLRASIDGYCSTCMIELLKFPGVNHVKDMGDFEEAEGNNILHSASTDHDSQLVR